MLFVHEFIKFFYYRLQEGPMRAEEIWELTDDIHDISSNLGFVAFSWRILAQIQQLLDNHDHKFVLVISAHTATDRA